MEPKRIGLVSMGPVSSEKKAKDDKKTFRFCLPLSESTDKTYPEFSYHDLVKNTEEDEVDPFAKKDRQEADELAAIARAFEDKYKTGSGKKRRRAERLEDVVDLGDGYDLDDPFIDNTEAYDEIVPINMTTKHGGFYINSGTLDFKFCSDSEDEFQVSGLKKKKKKRILTSDSEMSETTGEKKAKKKKHLKDGELVKKRKLNGDPLLLKKKKKLVSSEKIKLAKLKKGKNPLALKGKSAVNGHTPTLSSETVPSASTTSEGKSHGNVEIKQGVLPAQNGQVPAINLVSSDNESQQPAINNSSNSASERPKTVTVSCDVQAEAAAASEVTPKPKPEVPNLPETLTLKTLSNVDKMKEAAKKSEEGKCKFFTPDINDKLLQVETETRQMAPGERNVVYSHLAAHLPVSKETLMKRAKKLVTEQVDDRLREPIQRLRDAVNAVMPALIEKHQAECALADQKRQQQQGQGQQSSNKEKSGNLSNDSDDENSQDKTSSMSTFGENKDGGEKQDPAGTSGDKQKRVHAPRKKFEWTPQIRSLLCDVVRTKMEHYETMKGRSQTAEEYLRAFLDAEIKSLWPSGWMQTRMLFKESRDVHMKWTNPAVKPKKLLVPGASVSRPTSATNTPVNNQQASSGVKKSASSASVKMDDSLNSTSSSLIYASPDLRANALSSKLENLGEKGPNLLDYANNSYTAVAKSKQSTMASPINIQNSGNSNVHPINSLTGNTNAAKVSGESSQLSRYEQEFMQQFKELAASMSKQVSPTQNQVKPSQNQQTTMSKSAKPVLKTVAKNPSIKSVSTAVLNKQKVSSAMQSKGQKTVSTGSASVSVSKQQQSPNAVSSSGQRSGLITQIDKAQMDVLQKHIRDSIERKVQEKILQQSSNSAMISPKQVANTSGKHPVGSSSISPHSLSVSPSRYNVTSPGSLNLSTGSITPDKYSGKSERSAHNTSADSDDIPLANYLTSLSKSLQVKRAENTHTGSSLRSPVGAAKTIASTSISTKDSTGLLRKQSAQPHAANVQSTYQQQKPAASIVSVTVVRTNPSGTGPGVQKVRVLSDGGHKVRMHSTSGQKGRVSSDISASVPTANVSPQQQIKTSQPSSPFNVHLKELYRDGKMYQEQLKHKQIPNTAHSNVSHGQLQSVQVKHNENQISRQSQSQVSKSSQNQKPVSGQIPRTSNKNQVSGFSTSRSQTNQSPVQRSPQVSRSSQSHVTTGSAHGPAASSSPRPASKSPQASASWLTPGYEALAASGVYNTGLSLLDLAKATSAQGLAHGTVSPESYSQAAAALLGQTSPLSQTVTSPLHVSPQQRDPSQQYRRY